MSATWCIVGMSLFLVGVPKFCKLRDVDDTDTKKFNKLSDIILNFRHSYSAFKKYGILWPFVLFGQFSFSK